jgi:hypothetical protein
MARLITKRSSSPNVIPTNLDLEVGELAVNTADKALYTKHLNDVVLLSTTPNKVQINIATAKFGVVEVNYPLIGINVSNYFVCQLLPNEDWDSDDLADFSISALALADAIVFTLSQDGPIVGQFDIAYIKG